MAKNSNGLLCKLGIVKSPGAAVPHRKNTKDCATVDMPVPAQVTLVMQQHIGAPCTPTVKVGDEVFVGTIVGDSTAPFSAPIHSSVSGKVKKIDSILMQNGSKAQAVIIESDGQQTVDPAIKPPVINSDEDLIKAAHDSGLVGLGGAGFPTHIKISPKPEVKATIDYLLINAAECEPYLTPDVREILEDSENIVEGMKMVAKLLDVKNAVIGIEDNKPEAIKLMTERLAQVKIDGINFKVETLPSRYPQGGCVVMNVTSIAVLANYVATGMPLTTKRLTVDGSAISEPKNVRVPIGTPIKDIVEFCGGYKGTPFKIISGGPMMGQAMVSDEFPILKQNNGILIFDKQDAEVAEPSACIRCGRCVNACPMNLMPTKLEAYTNIGNTDELQKLNIMNCMECGCCSFVCPANRKLVQSIRLGKGLVRNASN